MEEKPETSTPEESDPPVPEAAPSTDPVEAPADEPAAEPRPEELTADPYQVALVEAMLFSVNKPISVEKLAEAAEIGTVDVEAALAQIERSLTAVEDRGIRLDRAAGGFRVVSRPEFDYPIRRLLGQDGKTKLSMAALETLAIIAYRQPVTAPDIAEIRAVNSSSSIRTLLERKLITTAGRKEVVGMPFLYKTTKEFLIHFGLSSPADLPRPEELDALFGIEPANPPGPEQAELFPDDATPAEPAAPPDSAASDDTEVGESTTGEGETPSPEGQPDAS
jgi:segregation and condensation protein B